MYFYQSEVATAKFYGKPDFVPQLIIARRLNGNQECETFAI